MLFCSSDSNESKIKAYQLKSGLNAIVRLNASNDANSLKATGIDIEEDNINCEQNGENEGCLTKSMTFKMLNKDINVDPHLNVRIVKSLNKTINEDKDGIECEQEGEHEGQNEGC